MVVYFFKKFRNMDCGTGFFKSETEDGDGDFAERDPSGRYGRVRDISTFLFAIFKKTSDIR